MDHRGRRGSEIEKNMKKVRSKAAKAVGIDRHNMKERNGRAGSVQMHRVRIKERKSVQQSLARTPKTRK
jgi:hypothetical protein